ncbi:MAG: hypothetical protein C4326_13125 [Ignavibacteria bacterium]
MKIRLVLSIVVAAVFALAIAFAYGSGEKTKKTSTPKKELKSCCSGEMKGAKECSDMEMKEGEAKGASSSVKSEEAKAERKAEVKEGDKK